MTSQAHPAENAHASRWRRPGRIALSLLCVFAPLGLVMLLWHLTESDAVALSGVPIGVLLAWLMLRARSVTWAELGMKRPTRRAVVVAFIATLLLLIATNPLGELLAKLTGWEPDLSKFDQLRGNAAALIAGLILVWTTAAFGEELLFRGFLMHSLADMTPRAERERFTWVLAVIISSVVFGLAHAYQGPAGMVLTAFIGMGLGAAFFAARRNLWAPILAHGLYDTVGFVFVYLSLDKQLEAAALVA